MYKSRREFLQSLTWLLAFGGTSLYSAEAQAKIKRALESVYHHKLSPWLGDNFERGHKLRDGELPTFPKNAEATVDFVIVGGGVAGLTSAYYLKDHNFLLLEQYDEFGGNSIGRSYRGMDYSLGAAYLGTNDGIVGQLIDELGIKPAVLGPERNSWLGNSGKWDQGTDSNCRPDLAKQFARLQNEFKPLLKLVREWQFPALNPQLAKLDGQTFASLLKGYDPKFLAILDNFCLSSLCGGIQQVSALAMIDLVADLFNESYVFQGGNPAIARALKSKVEKSGHGRCQTGCFVWQIDLKDNGASVVYQDKNGELHRVDCKQVIVAAPPLVASRIIPNMNDSIKGQLLAFKYGAYLVGNFCFNKPAFKGNYDNWFPTPHGISDFIAAETPYIAQNAYKPSMGSVLTAYRPYAYGTGGRSLLYEGNRQEISASLIKEMSKAVASMSSHLEQIVLSRWGHAMVVFRPGTYGRLEKIHQSQNDSYTLAHNSMYGIPCAESAIFAARRAADKALKISPGKIS
jgi:protoporphyrinogen oxidase